VIGKLLAFNRELADELVAAIDGEFRASVPPA